MDEKLRRVETGTSWSSVDEEWPGWGLPRSLKSKWDVDRREVQLTCRLEGTGYAPRSVAVRAPGKAAAVTGKYLRKLRLQSLAEASARHVVEWPEDKADAMALRGGQEWLRHRFEALGVPGALWPAPESKGRKGGPADRTLRLAAAIYRYCTALGVPPHVALQETFGLSPAGASNWVTRGRDLDLIRDWLVFAGGPRKVD